VLPQGTSLGLSGPGEHLSIKFTPVDSYVPPPESEDIINTVVWSTDSPQVIDFSTAGSPGLATSKGNAGGTNIGILAKSV